MRLHHLIDEIDAVGRHRGAGLAAATTRRADAQQLLVEMDGFEATKRDRIARPTARRLDPALLRPGRFDRQVVVPCPRARPRADPAGAPAQGPIAETSSRR